MLRRVFPISSNTQVIETGIAPVLPQFETLCIRDCGNVANINEDVNPNRTLAVFKMQADTQGEAQVVFNISFGSARVRIYDMPEGVNQGAGGANVVYDSIEALTTGTYQPVITSDKPYLFIDFLEKKQTQATAQIQCYANTSATSNPEPYYSELVDVDVTIEQGETVDVRTLDNAIRNDLLIYSTLRVVDAPSGSAKAKPNGGLVSVTAPLWSGTPATYPIHFAIKDIHGIEHCGNINVTTQNSAVTIEPPELVDDTAEVNENESIVIGVLNNDIGREQFVLGSLRIKTPPALGVATVNTDGTITYFAPSVGSDTSTTFEYEIRDFTGEFLAPATVTVNIYNVAPSANLVNDDYTFEYLKPISVQPTQNDILTDLNLASIRVASITGAVTNPRFDGTTFKADSVITTGSIFSILYEIDTNDGLTTLSAQMTFRKKGTGTQPTTLEPKIVLLDNSNGNQPIAHQGSLPFGNVQIGANSFKTVTIKNTGSSNLVISSISVSSGFSVQNFSGSIPPNGQQSVTLIMDSSVPVNHQGTLTVISNASPSPYIVNLNGGINQNLAPKLTVLEGNTVIPHNGSVVFGNAFSGQTLTKQFTLRNDGNSVLDVTSALSNGQFSSSSSGKIQAGQQVLVTVTFSSTVVGTNTGTLNVVSDDSNSPYVINLSANVLQVVTTAEPNIQVIDVQNDTLKNPYQTVDFGTHPTSALVERTLRIRNNGNDVLDISGIVVPSGYSISGSTAGSIAPSQTEDFILTLDTSTVGTKEDLLEIASNDPDTAIFYLNVKGIVNLNQPALIVENASTNQIIGHNGKQFYATGEVNDSRIVTFDLRNLGDNTLNVSDIEVTGDFTLESNFTSGQISAGGSQLISVKKNTATSGSKTGTLRITSNDPTNTIYIVDLEGKVLAAPAPDILLRDVSSDTDKANGDTQAFGTHTTDDDVSRFIQIVNQGNAALTISSISVTGDFSSPAFSQVIQAGSSATIEVTLNTASIGAKNGILTVNSDDGDTPAYTLNLNAQVDAPAAPQLVVIDYLNGEREIEHWDDRTSDEGASLNVGKVEVGGLNDSNKPATFLVFKNVGQAPLNITGISIEDEEYFSSNQPNSIVESGQFTLITVVGELNIDKLFSFIEIYSNNPTYPTFRLKVYKSVEYLGGSVGVIDGGSTLPNL